jgi:hypothetical protein
MFYYHGRDNAPFVFTGFDIWSWSRADCQSLVDFVLSDIWGLARNGPRVANGTASIVAAPGPARRSPTADRGRTNLKTPLRR